MLLDFAGLLYGPLYATFGVPGTLTPPSASPISITVIDRTKGVEVSASADLNTIRPAAAVRVSELTSAGVERTDLRRATLAMNGKTWRVEDYITKPSPNGEDDGELWLLLIEVS